MKTANDQEARTVLSVLVRWPAAVLNFGSMMIGISFIAQAIQAPAYGLFGALVIVAAASGYSTSVGIPVKRRIVSSSYRRSVAAISNGLLLTITLVVALGSPGPPGAELYLLFTAAFSLLIVGRLPRLPAAEPGSR